MATKKQPQSLTNLAIRQQVLLERLKTQTAKDFQSVFDAVSVATRDALALLGTPDLSEVSKTKLNAMLRELRAVNAELIGEATTELQGNFDKIAAWSANFEAQAFGVVLAETRLKVPNAKAIAADALARPLSVNGQLLEVFTKDWGAAEVDRVNDTIRKAWSQGWTLDRLTTVLNGTKKLNYSDGLVGFPGSNGAQMRRNAMAVARTGAQHVAQSARMVVWEENADIITGYRWLSTLDSRTTQICRSLDGNLYELDAGPVPPAHIGCRSTTVAQLSPKFDFLSEGRERATVDGPIPADTTYYEWLKTQPKEFQEIAIGKTRTKLFRDGGLSAEEFATLNLGRNFQPLTLEQMKQLEPAAFERAGLN